MSNRILNNNLVQDGSIVQLDKKSVADGALLGIVVVGAESLLFDAEDLRAESIDARVRCGSVGAKSDVPSQ